MLNSCILTGNLGADPEVFYSSEGRFDRLLELRLPEEKDRLDKSNLFSSSGRSRREVSAQGCQDWNCRDSRPAKMGDR